MRKKLWIASLLAALSITAASGVALAKQDATVTGATENWTVGTIDNKYVYGTSFEVPDATVEINGESVDAVATVTYPNGLTVSSESVMLDQAGVYTITYRANVGNLHCVEERTFTVENGLYLMQNENSSASYGHYDKFGANSDGLLVRLATNDTITFTQLVDMNAITSITKLFDVFITPDAYGTYDFTKLVIRFTDAVDSSKYLQIRLNKYWADNRGYSSCYADVTFADQPFVGYNTKYKVDDPKDANFTGTPFVMTFLAAAVKNNAWQGEMVPRKPDANTGWCMFNPASLELTVQNKHIVNLDNEDVFEEKWEGFPSGYARISMKAEGVMGQTANFCIKDLYGIDLQADKSVDSTPPVITPEISEDEMPLGQVGLGYQIPFATAYDLYAGNCTVKTNVYKHYASDAPVSVNVVDGKFVPTSAGWYTIVYTSVDAMGNEAKVLRNVFIESDLGDISIALADNAPTGVTLGSWFEIPEVSYTGDCGKANVAVKLYFGDKEFDVVNGKFLPEMAGEWKIVYTVTDYIGRTASLDYVINATAGEGYVLLDEIILPKIFLSDCEYVLPEFYATNYEKGYAERALCDVFVTDNNGLKKKYKAGDTFKPSVAENGDMVSIVYACGDDTLFSTAVPTVVVRNDAKKQVIGMNYLYGTDITTSYKYNKTDKDGNVIYKTDKDGNYELDENGEKVPETEWYSAGIEVKANKSAELVGWTFATPQLANNFYLVIEGLKAYSNFDGLKITLTDSMNESEKISILLNRRGVNTNVVVDGASYDIAGVSIEANEQYRVAYANKKFTFGGMNMPVVHTVNGEEFTGFSSNLAYVTVEMVNAEKGAAYLLRTINETNLSRRNQEVFAPNFLILGETTGNVAINSLFTTNKAMANDVFAPSTSLSMTVYAPDGSIVVDNNGLKLENVSVDVEYSYEMTQYGKYEVRYTTMEKNWVTQNQLVVSQYTYVIDERKPLVAFTNATQTTAKVGDVITLPTFVYQDNLTENENLRIVTGFYNPKGEYVLFKGKENAIKCGYEGTYKFIVMIFDEQGNMASITHSVVVSK